ncbi:hypothetical protein QUF76_09345 [Desulfobacterales bacterium HSG16]|nr:hypothetical protein [Desulfobacterales bacterium HSG16]
MSQKIHYQDGRFLPFIGTEDMEMMTKRPEFFTLRRFAPTGIRKKVFQFYKRLLNTQNITGKEKIRNASMVSIVGPLVQFADRLTPYARQTRSVGKYAQKVRNTIVRSKEPIQLLFTDLPVAVGLEPFDKTSQPDGEQEKKFEVRLKDALKKLIDADKILIETIRDIILEAFDKKKTPFEIFRKELTERAVLLITPCRDSELKVVLTAMSKTTLKNHSGYIAAVAAAAMTRPVRAWRDNDVNEFPTVMEDLARRFKDFETIVKSQVGFLESEDDRTRLVTFTCPDGSQSKKIVKPDDKAVKNAQAVLQKIKKDCSKADIEALMIILGDELLRQEGK